MTRCYCPDCRPIGPRKTYTPEFRAECEVRMLADWPHPHRVDYLTGRRGVRELRSEAAADAIIESLMKRGSWEDVVPKAKPRSPFAA